MVVDTAVVGDPPDLEATRTAWLKAPQEPARIRAYAAELARVGEDGEARHGVDCGRTCERNRGFQRNSGCKLFRLPADADVKDLLAARS